MMNDTPPKVVIIGAGIGGLVAAISLKRQLGFSNFTIYEQAGEVGGTWQYNTYPGAAADVETHFYCLSTDLRPDWRVTHIPQVEILAYWKSLTQKYGLYQNLVLNTKVVSADWDEKRQQYKIQVQDVRTKETRTDYANVVISGHGFLNIPVYPKRVPGMEKFKGPNFHTARWDHDVDLHNKRVAVIGNGCSGAQVIPAISKDPTVEIMNFCQSPHWIFGDLRSSYSRITRWIFSYVPFALRLYRFFIFLQLEAFYFAFIRTASEHPLKKWVTKDLINRIKTITPEKYHQVLIPDFVVGCKRSVFTPDYLHALKLPNVDLNYDGIAEFVEDGIVTKKGEKMDFDVIVYATGFDTVEYPIPVRGCNGKTVQEYYDEKDGPQAYYGTALPGFPNFFVLFGPNTGTSHGTAIYTEENQCNWIMQVIKPILKGQASAFEPTEEATEAHNQHLQSKLVKTVWSGTCASWYRRTPESKIHTLFPGSLTELWWQFRKPNFNDFKVTNGEKWQRSRRFWGLTKRDAISSYLSL
ncbi:FAD-binding Monooxygenase Superfamily protein [Abortiporus biennis]